MRLLLRRSAHTRGDDRSWKIAASPDSWTSEAWQWDLRLTPASPAVPPRPAQAQVSCELGGFHPEPAGDLSQAVTVRYDAGQVAVQLVELKLARELRLSRDPDELWVLMPSAVPFREGPREVRPGDALVMDGLDPCDFTLESSASEGGAVALFTLRRNDGQPLRWVP